MCVCGFYAHIPLFMRVYIFYGIIISINIFIFRLLFGTTEVQPVIISTIKFNSQLEHILIPKLKDIFHMVDVRDHCDL